MTMKRAEKLQKSILQILAERIGPLPEDVAAAVRAVYDDAKLEELVEEAASCRDLRAFRTKLQS
jgi:hypothetical protein